jgi:hypothetical protein
MILGKAGILHRHDAKIQSKERGERNPIAFGALTRAGRFISATACSRERVGINGGLLASEGWQADFLIKSLTF